MKDSRNVHGLESDLEDEKRDLRKDLESITEKARETRAELSPTSFVRERVFLLSGLALALGFALGYRRGVRIVSAALRDDHSGPRSQEYCTI